ncbi:MAG: VCBS repeat-containing protein [Planctomycetota bacterium]
MQLPILPTTLLALAPTAFALQSPPQARSVWSDPDLAGASEVEAGDFDGDGLLDLAASSYYDDVFVWYRQLPGNQFSRHTIFPINTAFDIGSADFDGDGDLDLYGSSLSTSEYGEDTVWWFENQLSKTQDPDAGFSPQLLFSFPNQDPRAMDAADFDGDGHVDLAVAFVYDEHIHLFLNPTGRGPQSPPVLVPVPNVNGVSVVEGVDFDADGDVDLLAGTAWNSSFGVNIYWYENYGAGVFGPRVPIAGGSEFAGMFALEAADMDGDGWMDVVATHDGTYGAPFVRWIRRLDAAGGQWSAPKVVDPLFFGADSDQCLEAVDLDLDGDVDIVGGSTLVDRKLRAWFNDGRGNFRPYDLEVGLGAHGITAADFNGDGRPELATAEWGECCYTGGVRLWALDF